MKYNLLPRMENQARNLFAYLQPISIELQSCTTEGTFHQCLQSQLKGAQLHLCSYHQCLIRMSHHGWP